MTIGKGEKYNASRLEEHQRDHALYIAFAPAEDPKIALAVVVENAGFGSDSAAPITRRIFDYVLLNHYPSLEDMAALKPGKAGAPIGKPRLASEVPLNLNSKATKLATSTATATTATEFPSTTATLAPITPAALPIK